MLYNIHAISDLLSELIVGIFYGRNRAAVHCAVSFLFTGSYRPTVLSFVFTRECQRCSEETVLIC